MQRSLPYDGRDQADQAEEYYDNPVRTQNRALLEENMKLKRLLRTHGISWSPSITLEPQPSFGPARKVSTRTLRPRGSLSSGGSGTDQKSKMPHLPMEVQLRILHYALTSKDPIIDPLSKIRPENITAVEKTIRETQLAIGLLATCRAFQTEGSRILWGNNSFTFTSHTALRNFAKLDLKYREGIKAINLRIIAKFYDDQVPLRTRKIDQWHHPSMKKDVALKVHIRPRENTLARKGFRVYAWAQVIDFLNALGPPHQPSCDKSKSRPRLLPNLDTMRIDFVNFFEEYTPYSEGDLHEAAGHDNGCTLSELMITGLPCTETGLRAGTECSGMVRDNGLFMDAGPAFVQLKTRMKPLDGKRFCKRLIRGWRVFDDAEHANHPHTGCYGRIPPVPDVPGAPSSQYLRPTVWKRVPISRDSAERRWVEFDRKKGFSIQQMQDELGMDMDAPDMSDDEDTDLDDEIPDFPVCVKCGEEHPIFV